MNKDQLENAYTLFAIGLRLFCGYKILLSAAGFIPLPFNLNNIINIFSTTATATIYEIFFFVGLFLASKTFEDYLSDEDAKGPFKTAVLAILLFYIPIKIFLPIKIIGYIAIYMLNKKVNEALEGNAVNLLKCKITKRMTRIDKNELFIAQLEMLNPKIHYSLINTEIEQIIKISKVIFDNKDMYPTNTYSIRKFGSYYIPTTIKLIETYILLQNSDIKIHDKDILMNKIAKSLKDIRLAFEKLSENMFEPMTMDCEAEIMALNTSLSMDGLSSKQAKLTKENKKKFKY